MDRDGAGPGACCEHDFGADPRLMAEACGFSAYLGERRDYGWCSWFFTRDGAEFRVGLEDLDGLSWEAAVELHDSGFGPGLTAAEWGRTGARVHSTREEGYAWAIVEGWSRARRLTWSKEACANMVPVVTAMVSAPERAPARPRAPARTSGSHEPGGPDEGKGESLLDGHADRTLREFSATFVLPESAKARLYDLLAIAARNEIALLPWVVTADARWGSPDRRQLDAHALFGDDAGAVFMAHFRRAAARFSKDTVLFCPAMRPAGQELVRSGQQPMWCFFSSADKLDILAFRLRMDGGATKVDYVGFFMMRPANPVSADHPLPVPAIAPELEVSPPGDE